MDLRRKFGAVLGAGALLLMVANTVFAVKPEYGIDVQKTADPATVPAGGGSVEYTISVENTGTKFFQEVTVDDDMAGCTLGDPDGDTDDDGKLDAEDVDKGDPAETWTYSCIVTGVTPGTENTAEVFACHNESTECNQETQNATGDDSVTVTLAGAAPTQADGDTEAVTTGPSGPSNAMLLVIALGVLLASIVLVKPRRPARQR